MEEDSIHVDDIRAEDLASSLEEVFGVQSAIDEAKLFIHGIENAGEDVRVYKRGKEYAIVWNTGVEELWFDFLSLDFLFVKNYKVWVVVNDEHGGGSWIIGVYDSYEKAKKRADEEAFESYPSNREWDGEAWGCSGFDITIHAREVKR